jgi:hypothetical protein
LFAQSIKIDTSDAAGTYQQLTSFSIGSQPYVKPGSKQPNDSAIHCQLAGQCGVAMPPGGNPPAALVTAVDGWLSCGASND